jgi:hypothetical protein
VYRATFSVLILAIALGACNDPSGYLVTLHHEAPEVPDTIYVDISVVDNAQILYEHFDAEYLLCLEGNQARPHYIEIRDFRFAHIVETNRYHLTFDRPCHVIYPNTITTLHNHRNGEPGHLCHLSHNDIEAFLSSPHSLMAVQCGPRIWSFFPREYVEQYPDSNMLPALSEYTADFPLEVPGNTTANAAGRVEG